MSVNSKFGSLVTLVGLTFAGFAQAEPVNQAGNLQAGLLRAKSVVDRAIAAAGGSVGDGGFGGGGTGGGDGGGGGGAGPWSVDTDELLESDALGLPILIQASTSLGQAASLSDQAKLAYLSFNFQLGNFRFSQACNRMGISRSQIARANTAAMQPPVGFLAAFGPDLAATVIELNALRVSEGCP